MKTLLNYQNMTKEIMFLIRNNIIFAASERKQLKEILLTKALPLVISLRMKRGVAFLT